MSNLYNNSYIPTYFCTSSLMPSTLSFFCLMFCHLLLSSSHFWSLSFVTLSLRSTRSLISSCNINFENAVFSIQNDIFDVNTKVVEPDSFNLYIDRFHFTKTEHSMSWISLISISLILAGLCFW